MRISDFLKQLDMPVTEGAPELLKAEMPFVHHIEKELDKHGYKKGSPEYDEQFKHQVSFYRKFGNVDSIKSGASTQQNMNVTEAAGNETRPADQVEPIDQQQPEMTTDGAIQASATPEVSPEATPEVAPVEPEDKEDDQEDQGEQQPVQPIETSPSPEEQDVDLSKGAEDSEGSEYPEEQDEKEQQEESVSEEMSDSQMAKREEIVKSMKKKKSDFVEKYGDKAEEVMYATATKMAMKEDEQIEEEQDPFQAQFAQSLNEGTEFKLDLQLDGLFESQGFEAEFSTQAKEIFEAAVNDVTKAHLVRINAYAAHVMECLVEEKINEMESAVDQKLNEAIGAWAEKNQIGIEQGVRVQVAESFMDKLGSVLKEHFVEVPVSKSDLYESTLDVVQTTNQKLEEQESLVESLKAELQSTKKQLCLESFVADCTVMQSEKIKELAKELVYESDESFKKKLNILKESYVEKKSTKKVETVVEDITPVVEEKVEEQVGDKTVLALANSLSKLSNKF